MVQAYKGYFERERFRPLDETAPITIPEYVEVYITVTGRKLSKNEETATQSDKEEVEKRLAMVESLSGILPPDVDLETVRAERIAKRALL